MLIQPNDPLTIKTVTSFDSNERLYFKTNIHEYTQIFQVYNVPTGYKCEFGIQNLTNTIANQYLPDNFNNHKIFSRFYVQIYDSDNNIVKDLEGLRIECYLENTGKNILALFESFYDSEEDRTSMVQREFISQTSYDNYTFQIFRSGEYDLRNITDKDTPNQYRYILYIVFGLIGFFLIIILFYFGIKYFEKTKTAKLNTEDFVFDDSILLDLHL